MKMKSEAKYLKELKELEGEVKFTHLRKGMTGVFTEHTIAVVKIKDKYYYGRADCSERDTYSKKLGRAISLGRAMKNYKDKKPTPLKNIPEDCRFKEEKK